jgi:hypothetical protein
MQEVGNMKVFKKFLIAVAFSLIAALVLPAAAVAAPGDFTFTASASPSKLAALGGEAKVRFDIENTGATNITEISIYISYMGSSIYDSDCCGETWNGSLAPGASLTLTRDVEFDEEDLDKDLTVRLAINNDADPAEDDVQTGPLKIASEDNVFKSSGGEEPQKDVYYVGETVTVTDSMRNSLAIEAADLTLSYYFKTTSHGTTSGDPIDLGDVAGGATEEYSFDYTFTEDDIGAFRIGSEIAYYVSGLGPYKEYNIAHDFVVEPAPTPTPTPEPTPTPTPEPTPEATPTPAGEKDTGSGETESTETQDDETAAAPTEAAETEEAGRAAASPSWLTIVIIALAALLAAAVIVLVVVLSKKNKGGGDDEFV